MKHADSQDTLLSRRFLTKRAYCETIGLLKTGKNDTGLYYTDIPNIKNHVMFTFKGRQ